MAESPGRLQRTKWAKRRQRILSAVGGAVAPAGRVQLRQGACCGRRGFSRTPQATHDQPLWARMERSAGVLRPWPAGRETLKNVGDPRSSYTGAATGEGRQLLRHSRGNPETAPCWHRRAATHQGRGRRRRTGNGNAHRMRLGSRIERRTRRWGKPTTRGRTRRKHAARKGHASRTWRTGIVCANLPAGQSHPGSALHGCACNRGTGCGKTARPGLHGGRRVTGVPTGATFILGEHQGFCLDAEREMSPGGTTGNREEGKP